MHSDAEFIGHAVDSLKRTERGRAALQWLHGYLRDVEPLDSTNRLPLFWLVERAAGRNAGLVRDLVGAAVDLDTPRPPCA
jgi:hypothetical protein